MPILDLENLFVRLALEDQILDIINSYMEMNLKFRAFTLNIVMPVKEGEEGRDSQCWHRDPEDKVVCKMFLYLTDVDEESGPFIYFKESHHLGRYRNVFPTAPPAGSYPSAKDVERVAPKENIETCIGKAGTIIFCETTGIHKGGYATSKERLMFTAMYTSLLATSPIAFKYPYNFDAQSGKLSYIQRYALDN